MTAGPETPSVVTGNGRRLGRPPAADSAETRQRLLIGARRAFAERGYDKTSNREIAEAAGVTATAIYHYFGSKAELYAAVYLDTQQRVSEAFAGALEGQDGFAASIDAALDTAVALSWDDPWISGFLTSADTDLKRHSELRELLGIDLELVRPFIGALVGGARTSGEISSRVDPQGLEDLIYLLFLGLARFSIETGDPHRHETTVAVLKQLLVGELLAEAPLSDGARRGTTAAR